jgi:type IX secretion system PorP/SprF family membrane protein
MSRVTTYGGRLALLALTLTTVTSLQAQDIHFAQYFHVPQALGPGTIGQFDGTYRVNVIFRQQWRSVTVPYRTFGMGGDARDVLGVKGLGAGAWIFNDRAGDSHMDRSHMSVGLSWTQRFGVQDAHAIAIGLQGGFSALSIDTRGLTTDLQYNGFHHDPTLPTGEAFARDALVHGDLHTGIAYRYQPARREMVQVGMGLFNLTGPSIGFLGGPGDPLDRRFAFHALTRHAIHAKWDLMPAVQYMAQGPFRELDLGAHVRYVLLDRFGLDRGVVLGMHWRADDAGYVVAGLEYDDWTFGLSYDINTSDLVPASRHRGGLEFAVVRIFRQRPTVPVMFKACPDQM